MFDNFKRPVNQILTALPQLEYSRLAPYLQPVSLTTGTVLYNPGQTITEVYFLEEAMVSLVSIMSDGSTTEISLIGNEGMTGLPVILGNNCATCCSMVQVSGKATKLPADVLKREFKHSERLSQLLLLYTQAQLIRVAQTAACNRQHPIEERLARWLLSAQDCLQTNELPLTQEVIANMLGVRRTSVGEAAGALQKKGTIYYRRGRITILNQDDLEATACECYGLVRSEFGRLLSCKQKALPNL